MKRIFLTLFLVLLVVKGVSQESYNLSSESRLTIDGTSTVHDWTVTANTMDGTLKAQENAPVEIDFEVAVADIKSERGATMDKKMHDALKKETHPKVIFSLKEVKDKAVMVGSLSIAGNLKDVEITCNLNAEGNNLKIVGEYGIALKDFNIEPPTAMFGQVVVGSDVTVKFDLVFTK